MRDMLDSERAVSADRLVGAVSSASARDLEDALRREGQTSASRARTPEQRQYLGDSLAQFWDAADRMFALARDGHEAEARAQIRLSLQARQAALGTAVARLLVENNESEEQTAARVQGIYDQVQRQVYWFLAATLAAIVRDEPLPDSIQPPAVRASWPRCPTSAASSRSSSSPRASRRCATSPASCTTNSARC